MTMPRPSRRVFFAAAMLAALAALAALAVQPRSAAAQPSPGAAAPSAAAKARARRHYEQAEAYRKAGTYDKAIEEYQAAYKEVPKPGFLFDVGLVYEQMGDLRQAVAYYDRYLAERSQGSVAEEAKARKVALERKIAAEDAARKTAEARAAATAERTKHVDALRRSARAKSAAGDHAGAAADLRAAHALNDDPELLFDMAQELDRGGDKKAALSAYQRYRTDAPAGPRVGDAIERAAVIEREIATAAAAEQAADSHGTAGAGGASGGADAGVSHRAPTRHGRNYKLLIAAGLAAAVGVTLDTVPNTAHNGQFDALDLAPVGLYGASAVMVALFVF